MTNVRLLDSMIPALRTGGSERGREANVKSASQVDEHSHIASATATLLHCSGDAVDHGERFGVFNLGKYAVATISLVKVSILLQIDEEFRVATVRHIPVRNGRSAAGIGNLLV
uniref:Uncharacterized protein n=1 Tax=Chrysotila carterae TaxID=13221 RepID=A0A7S4EUQ7_CHRCT